MGRFFKHKPGGYIYLAFNPKTSCTKIGYSRQNIKQRLQAAQLGSDARLELVHIIHCDNIACEYFEPRLHDMFNINRQTGEWFALCQETLGWLKTILVSSQLY